MNGSSPLANCNVTEYNGDGTLSTCNRPWTSVLFDHIIPALTDLDGDGWASELLTLDMHSSRSTLTFDFHSYYGSSVCPYSVTRIEVLLFNCPEWGTSIREIRLIDSVRRWILGIYYPPSISCNSLVRVCIPYSTTRRVLTLQFIAESGSSWLHLAEVEFHCTGYHCPLPPTTTPRPETPRITTTYKMTNTSLILPTAG